MRSLDRHRDAGAYALGVLDEADRFRFEDHLGQCPGCLARVRGFGSTTAALALYARATPPAVATVAEAGPVLLDGLVSRMERVRRAGRRRWLCAMAAAVVLAVAGPGVVVLGGSGDGAVRLDARDAGTGVAASVTASAHEWGTGVGLAVRDARGPRVCELVVVGKDGSRQTVTSWAVRAHDAGVTTTQSAVALHPQQIARFEVRTADGARLVTIPMR
ncbi:zf-HC2 domain-containing protein [Streptomyces sp. NBC_01003]|uniref:zf-HC2 domain-containing protein n=1 Tax=Streptomyces sp. NBC_01003 TaxID=2903714 RepID=UPI0038682E3E|nr:zf-HC2 domain-containing protein [Streptomyces sp. NBC_01003]